MDSLELLSWYVEDEASAQIIEKVSCRCVHDRQAAEGRLLVAILLRHMTSTIADTCSVELLNI